MKKLLITSLLLLLLLPGFGQVRFNVSIGAWEIKTCANCTTYAPLRPVLSVNNKSGIVQLTATDIPDVTNRRWLLDAERFKLANLPSSFGTGFSINNGVLNFTGGSGGATTDASQLSTGFLPDARLSNVGTAGTFGGAGLVITSINIDTKGRVTGVGTTTNNSGSGGGEIWLDRTTITLKDPTKPISETNTQQVNTATIETRNRNDSLNALQNTAITQAQTKANAALPTATYTTNRSADQDVVAQKANAINPSLTGQVGVNTSPNTKAVLDVASTTLGVLLPRMSTAQRNAIVAPPEGLEIYNLTSHAKEFFNGFEWRLVVTSVSN